MAWRKKRGKKWLVEWRFPARGPEARTYSRGGFGTAAAADAFIKVVDDAVAAGINWEPPRSAEEQVAADDMKTAMHAYLDVVEGMRAAGTYRNRAHSLELFLRFLAIEGAVEPRLSHLTKSTLSRFFAWLKTPESSTRGGRALDAVRKTVEHVQLFWAWCADDDAFIATTPRARKLEQLATVRTPRTPTRSPTWAEMDSALVQLAAPPRATRRSDADARVAALVLVCAIERCTGLRVSQAGRLIVSDPDLSTGVLTFRGELGKSHEERAGRLLPMATPLVGLLTGLVKGRDGREDIIPADLAFVEQYCRRLLARAWEAAGVPPMVWRQRPNHCFRKGFSSELARAGVSQEVRDVLTGHSTGIAGFYTDQNALPLREAVALVPSFSPAASEIIATAVTTLRQAIEAPRTPSGPNTL